jgi:hypothetical protein
MADEMRQKLLDGAQEALGAAAGVARHVLWYVSYHVDGRVRDFEDPGTLNEDERTGRSRAV